MKVILSADSTCDLNETIKSRYQVNIQPLHIILNGKSYKDGVDITPETIFKAFQEEKVLPQTSAPNPQEYLDYFKQWTDQGYEILHVSLSSYLSSAYQNASLAAQQLENVYPIDSKNLSTGMGLLVIEAAERIEKGMPAKEIAAEIQSLTSHVHASFVIDTLTYLHEGGRCSALAAFSANLLSIKPCIEVDNSEGSMDVGKKYRGSLKKVFKRYAVDQLRRHSNIKLDRIFITHSGTAEENIEIVKEAVCEILPFEEVLITQAGCTISSHCGPNTLGVLFMTE